MNEFGQQKTDNDQFAEFVRWNYPRIDSGTKIEFERCWDTAYSAGVQAERERLRLLAEAVLEAHSFDCRWCPFTNSEPDCTAAGCNDGQGCQCEACKVAREIT